ncbi:hypothetical protein [Chitinimonas sp.]|uniref:hypothetical protein n=1 Tax=Chitinimonas sp. TaxID=1934313 RepID=UPI002F959005
MPRLTRSLWLSLAAALLCLPSTSAAPASQATLTELRQAIGAARCQRDEQCKTVPAGAKACGGPAFYLPWSQDDGDAARIRQLAQQQSKERLEEIRAAGEMSDCRLIADPGAQCQSGACTLRPVIRGGNDPR